MDYKEQASYLKRRSRRQFEDADEDAMYQAAPSIENLLSRAEAAEARCKALERRLETAEKMVKEYQDELIPGYRERAEKAERERNAAISDLTYIARTYPVDLCDDIVCQYCKHYQNVNTGCPGWTENDCFEWRGAKEG